MVVPLLAAKNVLSGARSAENVLSLPLLGKKTTTVKTTKKGTVVTTETSFQVRAWEVAAILGTLAAVYGVSKAIEDSSDGSVDAFDIGKVFLGPIGILL